MCIYIYIYVLICTMWLPLATGSSQFAQNLPLNPSLSSPPGFLVANFLVVFCPPREPQAPQPLQQLPGLPQQPSPTLQLPLRPYYLLVQLPPCCCSHTCPCPCQVLPCGHESQLMAPRHPTSLHVLIRVPHPGQSEFHEEKG